VRRPLVTLPACLLALALLLAACDGGSAAGGDPVRERTLAPGALAPYRGLGTWVDVYDYVPGLQEAGQPPPVTPESVDDMAALGVETLFLQAAQDDPRTPGPTVDPALLGGFLRRAHAEGLDVVAWYLPRFYDLDADLRRIRALHRFRSGGQAFDGLALDVEWTQGVPDTPARNDALVELARRVRDLVGDDAAVGAIVLEPVLLELVNPLYWPSFPWERVRSYFDVWLPMSYWTNRREDSGFREGFAYTDENVKRLRADLSDSRARVHPIGGIGDGATAADYEGFVRASRKHDALGWSVYDFNSVVSSAWPRLRDGA
jgi:hypothetical protein